MYMEVIKLRKTKEDAQKTKEQILKTALDVFSKKGYQSTTLEDIAKAAGVTRGAIYWHFENKASLYNTLIEQANVRGDKAIADAMQSGGTLRDICKRILVAQWQLLEEDEEYRATMSLVMFNTGLIPELIETQKALYDDAKNLIQTIASYCKVGMEMGQLKNDRDPIEVANAFLAYQQGVAVYWLQDPTRFSIKEMAPVLADIFINGI